LDRVPVEVKAMFPENGAEGYYYSVWTGMSGKQQTSATAPPDIPLPASDGRNTQTQFRDRDGLREAYHFTERGECVLAGRPVHSDLAGMNAYALRLSATGFIVLAVGLGGGWILTSRSMRPIEGISASARRISEGNLAERIPVGRPGNELNQLAGVLNATFSRLEDSFAQQKRFTADASHELRTPLTVLITETQAALSRERSSEEYREALSGNLETARQMKGLAEALLELARLDTGEEGLEGSVFDLSELGADVMQKLKPLADARSTKLCGEFNPALAKGSPERLALVIKNLIENAIHHGKHSGHIAVRSGQDGDKVFISVSDDGPGIAAADLPHLFERFYRADKSRTGSDGRYGLGLAICKGLVEAEGGTISVESRKGQGATFTVSLPLGA
jgi:heavy metal sensor kinase